MLLDDLSPRTMALAQMGNGRTGKGKSKGKAPAPLITPTTEAEGRADDEIGLETDDDPESVGEGKGKGTVARASQTQLTEWEQGQAMPEVGELDNFEYENYIRSRALEAALAAGKGSGKWG